MTRQDNNSQENQGIEVSKKDSFSPKIIAVGLAAVAVAGVGGTTIASTFANSNPPELGRKSQVSRSERSSFEDRKSLSHQEKNEDNKLDEEKSDRQKGGISKDSQSKDNDKNQEHCKNENLKNQEKHGKKPSLDQVNNQKR